MKRVVLVALLAAVSVGCRADRPKRVATSYSSLTKPTFHPVPSAQPAKVPDGVDAIPAEEDYEARASATISEANLQAQLIALENEMPF